MSTALSKLITSALPAFVRDDYPRFAQALDEYYAWESTYGALSKFAGHDARLDVDSDGLDAVIEEMGFAEIPASLRRAFVATSREFMASRGSVRAWEIWARVFGGDARLVETAPYMLEPSAARRIAVTTVVLEATGVPRGGRITQAYAGFEADIVEAWEEVAGFTVAALRTNGKPLVAGPAVIPGFGMATVSTWKRVEASSGKHYSGGDVVRVITADAVFEQTVVRTEGLPTGFEVLSAGSGYKVGETVSIGATRCRGEIAEVDANGAIISARLVYAEGFDGVPVVKIVSRQGVGGVLTTTGNTGRPAAYSGDKPYGIAVAVEIDGTGTGFAASLSGYVEAPSYIRVDHVGVIGVASVLTDSRLYADASYKVEGRGVDDWGKRGKELNHRAGRHVEFVAALPSALVRTQSSVQTTAQRYVTTDPSATTGETAGADLFTTPHFSSNHRGGETLSASLETL